MGNIEEIQLVLLQERVLQLSDQVLQEQFRQQIKLLVLIEFWLERITPIMQEPSLLGSPVFR
jgi:hypothetical protein